MRYLVGEFPSELGIKYRAFCTKKSQYRSMWVCFLAPGVDTHAPCTSSCTQEHENVYQAHESAIWAPGRIFFIFLGICFYIRCLGTWKHNFSLCNVLWGLLNLHSLSSQVLRKSSDVLLCLFAWFLLELQQNTLKLLCFGNNRITNWNIENIVNVLKS